MKRFAVLFHDHPVPHWDLLLEGEGDCWTWRLLAAPASGGDLPAERIPAHRLKYLSYCGPVSGNRGQVIPWDAGDMVWVTATDQRVRALLYGDKCAVVEIVCSLDSHDETSATTPATAASTATTMVARLTLAATTPPAPIIDQRPAP